MSDAAAVVVAIVIAYLGLSLAAMHGQPRGTVIVRDAGADH